MKKLMAILFALLLTVAACQSADDTTDPNSDTDNPTEDGSDTSDGADDTDDENEGESPDEESYEDLSYVVVDVSDLEPSIQETIESLKEEHGYYVINDNVIAIFSGEKTSGGYDITVDSVEAYEGHIIINVDETSPDPDGAATTVMTYPTVVVRLDESLDDFEVISSEGTFDALNPELEDNEDMGNGSDNGSGTMLNDDENPIQYDEPIHGVYEGQIDNNSIEISVDKIFIALRHDDVASMIEGIEPGDHVVVTASVSPADQILLETIELED